MNTRIQTTLVGSLLTAIPALGADYTITDLGTVGGDSVTTFPGSGAAAIANNGDVVGFSVSDDDARDVRGFHWIDGGMLTLGPIGADVHSQAFAINDTGGIVGTSYILGGMTMTAVRWDGAGATVLGEFVARGINDAGIVVGERQSSLLIANREAVRWENGSLTSLGTLGGPGAGARAVDDLGRIVGSSLLADEATYRAFLWQDGAMADLGTLGGQNSYAYDINAGGSVVGFSQTSAGVPHAFIFEVDGSGGVVSRTDLGELSGGHSSALAINARGDVVGVSDAHAVLWRGGALTDLNTALPADPSWFLETATDINDQGQIVGVGRHYGLARAFLLTPMESGAGDVNGDGVVDTVDLLAVLGAWGPCETPCPPSCDPDLDGDCDVGVTDLLEVLSNWS